MRKLLLLTLFISFIFENANSQTPEMKRLDKKFEIICYATDMSSGVSLMPPKNITHGKTNSTNIVVNYSEGFTPEAKAAFQYAVDIWAQTISSPVTININAEWKPLAQGVLGSASWATAFGGFEGALVKNVWYPVALAEKMAGRDLNDINNPDIVASFSSTFDWYLGTDGNPGEDQYDLVSVVLHEIGHGLGFVDSYSYNNGIGGYGINGFPFIFDTYLVDASSVNFIETYENDSEDLGDALTDFTVLFDSPIAKENAGSNIKLYSPSTWDAGSSIAHLDETKYNGSPNSLMTPQIGPQEVMHNPGPITLDMFAEMGWEYTYIKHTKLPNTEDINANIFPIVATIVSDNEYDAESVTLHYSTDGLSSETEVQMTPTGNSGEYSANIPSLKLAGQSYAYYITVDEELGRTFSSPSLAPEFVHIFTTNSDTEKPVISHDPPNFIRDTETFLTLQAMVKDFLPLAEVTISYNLNGGSSNVAEFELIDEYDSIYEVNIPLSSLNLAEGDEFNYTISALDIAQSANATTLPEAGIFTVPVVSLAPSVIKYQDDFNEESAAFFSSNNFRISLEDGFTDNAVHSDHPYKDGTGADAESNYTLEMRIPIILAEIDAIIQFDEVVLVEPGSSTNFTSPQFFDYVVVEGSKDGGTTWVPFTNGYDSRSNADWLELYNSSIDDDQNAQAVGSADLFATREIDMLSNGQFQPGDEILIRFRLFADELAHGWGWAIDNLKIQIDSRPPVIKHNHLDFVTQNTSIPIVVNVTDNVAVDSLAIQIFRNGEANTLFQFDAEESISTYEANLNIEALPLNESIEYRIVAYDNNEPEPNIAYLPSETEFFSVKYLNLGASLETYSSNFNSTNTDFVGNFFDIKSEEGFSNGAIHTSHPYNVGFGLEGTSNFAYTLTKPVKISATKPLLAYDEVVLVEKYASDNFGTPSFEDFVIVEGSKDNGNTWIPFLDGYDSRKNPEWLAAYNSESDGEESLYKYRIINMTSSGDFQAGDEVLIRFRLFSDDAINAWGWAIDNLEVQTDAITAIDQLAFEEISLYPNPTSGTLNISVKNNSAIGDAEVQIFNYKGQSIYSGSERGIENTYFNSIDVSKFPKGIYLFKLSNNSGSITKKVIIN